MEISKQQQIIIISHMFLESSRPLWEHRSPPHCRSPEQGSPQTCLTHRAQSPELVVSSQEPCLPWQLLGRPRLTARNVPYPKSVTELCEAAHPVEQARESIHFFPALVEEGTVFGMGGELDSIPISQEMLTGQRKVIQSPLLICYPKHCFCQR